MRGVVAVALWGLAFMGAVAVGGAVAIACVATSIWWSPWSLFATVPIGLAVWMLSIGAANAVLNWSVDWADR